MIKRDIYLNKLIRSMWNDDVKVITGIRRCGKSVLLFDLFYNYLLKQGTKEEQIIRIELDQRRNYKYRNPIVLCDHVEELIKNDPETRYYLLIDEVQMAQEVRDPEVPDIKVTIYDMLNELKSYKNLDVYVTGSNSRGLSSDILTEFRGRATQIKVYPFSFSEYYSFVRGSEKEALDQYMLYGGMPKILSFSDEKEKKDYLIGLFNEVYIKDIVERNTIKREDLLNNILDYLASQIGSLTNPANISNTLTSVMHDKTNSLTVANYIGHIKDAFLIQEAKRYDVKGKRYFSYPMKYYYTDIGLRNARLNFRQYDPGHIMENLIYNELICRGYSVDVGVVTDRTASKNLQREIDFVINDADRKIYVQSALMMDEDDKALSELSPLLLTKDFFKKIIIRNDIPHSFYDNNGILHLSLLDFLLDKIDLF